MLHRTLHAPGSVLLGLCVALTASCDRDDREFPTAASPAGVIGELSAGAQTSNGDVVVAADDPSGTGPAIGTVVGQSHLTRNHKGLRANVRTSGLTPGDVVTMWITTFQNPDGCDGACDIPPEDFPGGLGSTQVAGAAIVPNNGRLGIAGKLDVGDEVVFGGMFGGPVVQVFDNPFGSEVHLVVRTHGPPIPGRLDEQMSLFPGGCDENACENIQVALYEP